jgi:hypothetical protein
MKKRTYETTALREVMFLFYFIVTIISAFALGNMTHSDINSMIAKFKIGDIEAPENCTNLTVTDTAYCLNKYVKTIFKYKSREDSENPTFEELVEEGGDCLNWADLYIGYIDELGFDSRRPIIDTGSRSRHTFAVISDDTGYCILDQETVACFALGNQLTTE